MPECEPHAVSELAYRIEENVLPIDVLIVDRFPNLHVLCQGLRPAGQGEVAAHHGIRNGLALDDRLPAHATGAPAGEQDILDRSPYRLVGNVVIEDDFERLLHDGCGCLDVLLRWHAFRQGQEPRRPHFWGWWSHRRRWRRRGW